MAASEELGNREPTPEPQSWRPGEAMLSGNLSGSKRGRSSALDWIKSLFGLFGRGAPA